MFTLIVISTLQNDRLNRGYYLLLYVLPYLCTFAPSKITFAAVFYIGSGRAYLIYIWKSLKRFYLMFAAVFRLACMFALYLVFGTFAAVFFRFRFHSLFVSRKLCVKQYASLCISMQSKNVCSCRVL